MKTAATSPNADVRKKMFEQYFEQFEELPSYLFDNEHGVDARLLQTVQDIRKDPDTSERMRKGIALLMARLPAA